MKKGPVSGPFSCQDGCLAEPCAVPDCPVALARRPAHRTRATVQATVQAAVQATVQATVQARSASQVRQHRQSRQVSAGNPRWLRGQRFRT